MAEWTEQEEQEIIERAKTGDPEANYELSLWALHRSEEEPDEPRWNRLAAKCLVKAAQAGYEPAKKQMDVLLHPDGQPKAAPKEPAPKRSRPAEPVSIHDAREAAARRAPAHQTTARHVPPSEPEDDAEDEEEPLEDDDDWDDGFDPEEDDEEAPAPRKGRSGRSSPSGAGRRARDEDRPNKGKWGDAQWRRMEIICVAVCAVLLVFIAVMLLTSRGGVGSTGETGPASAIPPAGQVAPAENADGVTQAEPYPDEATKNAIMAADLSIQPENEDYVSEPTSATVSVGSMALRMRKGPNTTYDQLSEIPNETVVSVYAQKNDWDLVLYESDTGPVYGWCNSQYLILGVGPSATPGATQDPNASVG